MHNDFLDSVKGRLFAYRKRKKRVFEFRWSEKLQSKSSASLQVNACFQNELLKAMARSGHKGPFTGRLAVELFFRAGSRNSPEVHSLVKHYLDLLQEPVRGISLLRGRTRILLRDDAQIEFLSCSYETRMGDGLRLRARRLSDFFEDLELYHDVTTGNLGQQDMFSENEEQRERRSAISDYDRHLAGKESFVAHFGRTTFDKWELMLRRDAQEAALTSRRLEPRTITALLRPRYHHLRDDPGMSSVLQSTSRMILAVYEHPLVSMDFGPRAVEKGQSKEFKERVRRSLLDAKERLPLLYPLLVPCRVTALYLAPRRASKIDLDNLMRKAIIPAVHEILQPPAPPADFLLNLDTPRKNPRLAQVLERYKRAPKFHITGYQICCLPRAKADPENGNVRLILHSGSARDTTWQSLDSALTEWEESDPRDS